MSQEDFIAIWRVMASIKARLDFIVIQRGIFFQTLGKEFFRLKIAGGIIGKGTNTLKVAIGHFNDTDRFDLHNVVDVVVKPMPELQSQTEQP